MKTISISVLSGSNYFFSHIAEEIADIEAAFMQAKKALNAKNLNVTFSWHVDIMDGQYVQSLSFEPKLIEAFLSCTSWPSDLHFMTDSLERYANLLGNNELMNKVNRSFVHLGTQSIYETESATYNLSFNPDEQIAMQLLAECSSIMLMSVKPGKGGQKFIDISYKIEQVKGFDDAMPVAVDGGINEDTIEQVKLADTVIVGSAFMKQSKDTRVTYLTMLGELFAD